MTENGGGGVVAQRNRKKDEFTTLQNLVTKLEALVS